MVSPFKIQADLTESLNNWISLLPDGARAVGMRLTEEYDYRRDRRRMRNILAAVEQAVPRMEADAAAPDDDWLSEWFELASKRNYPDWQHLLGKMMAHESNEPNSVPLRYFADMTRLDKEVMAEFQEYCGWYVSWLKHIVKNSTAVPRYLVEANLVAFTGAGQWTIDIKEPQEGAEYLIIPVNGEEINIKNFTRRLHVGNYWMTEFGQFIYHLLDPKPPSKPDLADSLRVMWKNHLHITNSPE